MIVNRLKKGESTLCTYTTTGEQIHEGHILGYGDNYPCIILYNRFEGKFEAVEFGYYGENYIYRNHDLLCQTIPWTILGHIENPNDWRKYVSKLRVPRNFDYTKDLSQWYNDHLKLEKMGMLLSGTITVREDSLTQQIIYNTKSW